MKDILAQVETWPKEDQEELAEAALEIKERRKGPYRLTSDERKVVEEAIQQLDAGQRISDQDMQLFWKRAGAV